MGTRSLVTLQVGEITIHGSSVLRVDILTRNAACMPIKEYAGEVDDQVSFVNFILPWAGCRPVIIILTTALVLYRMRGAPALRGAQALRGLCKAAVKDQGCLFVGM